MGLTGTESARKQPLRPPSHPRILLVSTAQHIAGAENSLLLLAEHLRGTHHLRVACPQGSLLEKEVLRRGCPCIGLSASFPGPVQSLLGRLLAIWRATLAVHNAAEAWRPDIIHANSIYSLVACVPAAIVSGAKLIWHARDLAGGWMVRPCGWFCQRVIAVSHCVAGWLKARGVKDSKIEVIHNGLDSRDEKSPASAAEARASRRGGPFVFANVGQFVPWKRQLHFLAAAARVRAVGPHAEFWLVGDDLYGCHAAYRRKLSDFVRGHDLSQAVVFRGWIEDLAGLWREVDCLVHTAQREPFGRVVIEAMKAGVPVIAVNSCGPAEILDDGRTGILVAPGDMEALAKAMLRIATDSGLAERLAHAAREDVEQRFGAAQTARRVADVYADVLEN